jgi:hypothetical protein
MMATLGMARQFVVGDRLPWRGIGDEPSDARSNALVTIEGAHPDAEWFGVVRVEAEERRAAISTEPLLPAIFGLPYAEPILADDDPERTGSRVRVR